MPLVDRLENPEADRVDRARTVGKDDDRGLGLLDETGEASEAPVATRFEWRAAEAGRPLEFEAPPGMFVHGDRLRLEQALGNLVDNALRHGAGTVRLEAVPAAGTVELHVRDEGAGLAPDFLPHAFKRFTRPSPDRGGRGSGLGLSIVHTIALAHDGSAEATTGGGADVWITLPRQP